jgi:hypothetical protein
VPTKQHGVTNPSRRPHSVPKQRHQHRGLQEASHQTSASKYNRTTSNYILRKGGWDKVRDKCPYKLDQLVLKSSVRVVLYGWCQPLFILRPAATLKLTQHTRRSRGDPAVEGRP